MRKLVLMLVMAAVGIHAQDSGKRTAVLSRALGEVEPGYLQSLQGKCGTPLTFDVYRHWNDLSPGAVLDIRRVLQRPLTQTSKVSPSGRFRVHYDTTGVNTPQAITGNPATPVLNSYGEFTDSVCSILDHVWEVEINELGFEAPPGDNGSGGGPEYDVYIQNLQINEFGYTDWPGEQQYQFGDRERYATYITIDNDFLGYRTEGLNGLRVTLAHEFNHAIQVGSYGIWTTVPNSDFYFYELTAVWMEDVVYNNVNDYYFDLPRFFQSFKDASQRSLSFSLYSQTYAGYERSVWNHFLEERFGRDIIRQVWEKMKTEPALESMDDVLRSHGATLASAFAEFAGWNLYTASNADPARYYKEGSSYPIVVPNARIQFSGSTTQMSSLARPLSIQYFEFDLPGDSVTSAITNVNFPDAYSDPARLSNLSVTLTRGQTGGAVQNIGNGLKVGLVTDVPADWRTFYWGRDRAGDVSEDAQPAPNPFRLSRSLSLTLPLDGSLAGDAQVFILTVSFDLVFSGNFPIVDSFGKKVVYLPSSGLTGKVMSGVYFIYVKTEEREYRWKVAILQ